MNNLVILVIGIVITIICAAISFWEKRKDNQSDGKSDFYNISTFIAIVMGAIVAFYSGYSSLNDKIESDNLAAKSQKELQSKSDMIIQIQEENKQEVKNLNSSLTQANAKIIRLQTDINNNIVGSTDPCFIVFQTASDKKGYTVIVNE